MAGRTGSGMRNRMLRALFFANPQERRLGESMRSHCVLLIMVVGDLVGKARVHGGTAKHRNEEN